MRSRTEIGLFLVLCAVHIHLGSAADTHSLQYMITSVTPGIRLPNFTTVGLVDGEQFVYYDSDSREVIPKTEWMKENEEDDYWKDETRISRGNEESYEPRISLLMQLFNQSEGFHIFQWMYGCEQDDDGNKRGYSQYGYDGEDFLSLDLKTGTWTAPNHQAAPTKKKWDVTEGGEWAGQIKGYLKNECIDWLKKYVGYGRSILERKVPPEVSLFQKDSSSPVVCHATGFYPKDLNITWQKNGEDLHEDVDLRETLPNLDGTFQKRSILTVSPEELKNNHYTCVVHHSSLEEDRVLKVSDRRVLSGGVPVGVIVVVMVAVLLISCVGFVIWKKRMDDSKLDPYSTSDPDSRESLNSNSSKDSFTSSDTYLCPVGVAACRPPSFCSLDWAGENCCSCL